MIARGLAAALVLAAGTALADPAPRPLAIPYPAENPFSPEKHELGRQLFFDTRLSASGTIACATCHNPAKGFSDGLPQGQGEGHVPLPRNTPSLWNLAWAKAFFWDGRAASLEEQAQGPITAAKEMNLSLAELEKRLKSDPDMRLAFAQAFPENPRVTAANALKAIATFERSFVSPKNRVDEGRLTPSETRGKTIFEGKAGCAECHNGFAFTDHAFHNVRVENGDQGRGPVIGMPALNGAFKTPSLRGITASAPYMHDGSLATLEEVVAHYESTSDARGEPFTLADGERADLLAYLKAVGEGGSEPEPLPPEMEPEILPPAVATLSVSQKNRAFAPHHVEVAQGATLTIHNDDDVEHTVRMRDGGVDFASDIEKPGADVKLTLPRTGTYRAFCGIHPGMELIITVK